MVSGGEPLQCHFLLTTRPTLERGDHPVGPDLQLRRLWSLEWFLYGYP